MIIKPPTKLEQIKLYNKYNSIFFLAGSIEMDKAERWQDMVSKELDDKKTLILNPRRDEWNSDWKQNIKNKEFVKQVNWELDGIQYADIVLMYFDPNTKSPVTMLELGLIASECNGLIVCCPEGFWRKGNVDIVCKRYKIKIAKDLNDLIKKAKQYINKRGKIC